MNWEPIKQYREEMGTVVVWLRWPQYSGASNRMEHAGTFMIAYRLNLSVGHLVWVDANGCVPIETTGRKVFAFLRVTAPEGKEA